MRSKLILSFALLLLITLPACDRSKAPPNATSARQANQNDSGRFQTHFQDESQFIVESILSDVGEMLYYAKHQHPPDASSFSVAATETPNSSLENPSYNVEIIWEKGKPLKLDLTITQAIWSPQNYEAAVNSMAEAIGLSPGTTALQDDTSLLQSLSDGLATTLETQNQAVSKALQVDFTNPNLHEQASVLLGTFALREHSHYFYDTRAPLCRMAAHLLMAQFLAGKRPFAINGQIAEVMLLTLMNNQAAAVSRLSSLEQNKQAPTTWLKVLAARNTFDYRPLTNQAVANLAEKIAWFIAFSETGNAEVAWAQLKTEKQRVADFYRIAKDVGYSVETGNQLLELALPLEFAEASSIYRLACGKVLGQQELVVALNQKPERCFAQGADGTTVKVIGWGQWAMFFQRQFCNALVSNYEFMTARLGVPDDAKAFAAKAEQSFSGLLLYPFVRRLNAFDQTDYRKSVDEGLRLALAMPNLVPARCWNFLYSPPEFAEAYLPDRKYIVNDWFKHNPPPGTAYDPSARLKQPTLIGTNPIERVRKLHELAPYDLQISIFLLEQQYTNSPTEAQALALFGPVLPYYAAGLKVVAWTVLDQPDRYEQLLLQAAAVDPSTFYALGDYFVNKKQETKAEHYFAKAEELDPDSLRAASYAGWRITYHLKRGERQLARKIADAAADVYSSAGLQAKAKFHEELKEYSMAFEWYAKVYERYEEAGPLVQFCARYKEATGNDQFAGQLQNILAAIFPQGIEKVSLANFSSAPTDGVFIGQENELIRSAGMKQGDVIVAANGTRVHTFRQYDCARDLSAAPQLALIVWQGDGYHEIKASPPAHRFGVTLTDYGPGR